MGHRSFKRSGNSRPKTAVGSPVPMPLPEHDGDETVQSLNIRYFRVDLSSFTGTPHVQIRNGVLQYQGVHGAELRGPMLFIKILLGDNEVHEDQSLAAAALKSALKSLKVLVTTA